MVLIDRPFKDAFKKVSQSKKDAFVAQLRAVFELPPTHFARYALDTDYQWYPVTAFDAEAARRNLIAAFEDRSFFIGDPDQRYGGGYPGRYANKTTIILDEDEQEREHRREVAHQNWEVFQAALRDAYWNTDGKEEQFNRVGEFSLFEDREPKTMIERYMREIIIFDENGKVIPWKYKYFNIPATLNYYETLFRQFFPEYLPNARVSTKGNRCYAKRISNALYLGIDVDFDRLKKELQHSYLEFPSVHLRVFNPAYNPRVKGLYEEQEQELNRGHINLWHFIGHSLSDRIGDSAEDPTYLKRELYFRFEVLAFYLHQYLGAVEEILLAVEMGEG